MPLSNGVRNENQYFKAEEVRDKFQELRDRLTLQEECGWCGKNYRPYVEVKIHRHLDTFKASRPRSCYCCDNCANLGEKENAKIRWRTRNK